MRLTHFLTMMPKPMKIQSGMALLLIIYLIHHRCQATEQCSNESSKQTRICISDDIDTLSVTQYDVFVLRRQISSDKQNITTLLFNEDGLKTFLKCISACETCNITLKGENDHYTPDLKPCENASFATSKYHYQCTFQNTFTKDSKITCLRQEHINVTQPYTTIKNTTNNNFFHTVTWDPKFPLQIYYRASNITVQLNGDLVGQPSTDDQTSIIVGATVSAVAVISIIIIIIIIVWKRKARSTKYSGSTTITNHTAMYNTPEGGKIVTDSTPEAMYSTVVKDRNKTTPNAGTTPVVIPPTTNTSPAGGKKAVRGGNINNGYTDIELTPYTEVNIAELKSNDEYSRLGEEKRNITNLYNTSDDYSKLGEKTIIITDPYDMCLDNSDPPDQSHVPAINPPSSITIQDTAQPSAFHPGNRKSPEDAVYTLPIPKADRKPKQMD